MVAPVGTIQAFSETSVTLSEMLREPQLWSAENRIYMTSTSSFAGRMNFWNRSNTIGAYGK